MKYKSKLIFQSDVKLVLLGGVDYNMCNSFRIDVMGRNICLEFVVIIVLVMMEI